MTADGFRDKLLGLVGMPTRLFRAAAYCQACRGFDWTAQRRSYDHAVPGPCRYDLAAP